MCNELLGSGDIDAALHNGRTHRNLLGRNKLYQMSMYTMDLEDLEQDPMSRGMLPEATYRVSGIDPAVSTRDIVRCLSGLSDSEGRRVMFEIIWIDDTTFLVGSCQRDAMIGIGAKEEEEEAMLKVIRDHGLVIQSALTRRFSQETVEPLNTYRAAVITGNKKGERDSIFARVATLLGFGKRKQTNGEESTSSAKRRRLN